jgi:hypothetical protein
LLVLGQHLANFAQFAPAAQLPSMAMRAFLVVKNAATEPVDSPTGGCGSDNSTSKNPSGEVFRFFKDEFTDCK